LSYRAAAERTDRLPMPELLKWSPSGIASLRCVVLLAMALPMFLDALKVSLI
jgi:hypothetical protein